MVQELKKLIAVVSIIMYIQCHGEEVDRADYVENYHPLLLRAGDDYVESSMYFKVHELLIARNLQDFSLISRNQEDILFADFLSAVKDKNISAFPDYAADIEMLHHQSNEAEFEIVSKIRSGDDAFIYIISIKVGGRKVHADLSVQKNQHGNYVIDTSEHPIGNGLVQSFDFASWRELKTLDKAIEYSVPLVKSSIDINAISLCFSGLSAQEIQNNDYLSTNAETIGAIDFYESTLNDLDRAPELFIAKHMRSSAQRLESWISNMDIESQESFFNNIISSRKDLRFIVTANPFWIFIFKDQVTNGLSHAYVYSSGSTYYLTSLYFYTYIDEILQAKASLFTDGISRHKTSEFAINSYYSQLNKRVYGSIDTDPVLSDIQSNTITNNPSIEPIEDEYTYNYFRFLVLIIIFVIALLCLSAWLWFKKH